VAAAAQARKTQETGTAERRDTEKEEDDMTARKKATLTATRARRSARKAARGPRTTGEMLRETWGAAMTALTAAEEEMARQLRRLLRRNRITPADAATALAELRVRFARERARARRRLDRGASDIAARLDRDRKSVARALDSAVHRALASFDIPSRQEVGQLTRKVDELSRRIGGLRTPTRRKRPARA
jgi:poly(hydroxyalkanoate) granule associated protein phasin